jgi:hypothetical protein
MRDVRKSTLDARIDHQSDTSRDAAALCMHIDVLQITS